VSTEQSPSHADTDRLLQVERENAERLATAHAAIAAAQERSYWLDRWQLDLNAVMRKPGAQRVRTAMRVLRELRRIQIRARRVLERQLREARHGDD
jgi:hypothetical protein